MIPEKYRLKALNCENLAREASDPAIKFAWAEIAIEWHALANRIAQEQSDIEQIDVVKARRTRPPQLAASFISAGGGMVLFKFWEWSLLGPGPNRQTGDIRLSSWRWRAMSGKKTCGAPNAARRVWQVCLKVKTPTCRPFTSSPMASRSSPPSMVPIFIVLRATSRWHRKAVAVCCFISRGIWCQCGKRIRDVM